MKHQAAEFNLSGSEGVISYVDEDNDPIYTGISTDGEFLETGIVYNLVAAALRCRPGPGNPFRVPEVVGIRSLASRIKFSCRDSGSISS